MEFRVRAKSGELLDLENVLLAPNGKVYRSLLVGLEEIVGAKPEFLVGKDKNGEKVFENDLLVDEYSQYLAGLDMDMGAVLVGNSGKGGITPFKQSGLKALKGGNSQ